MKQWKRELRDAIIAEFDKHEDHFVPEIGMGTDRWVKFSDVAKKLGYKKVLAVDIREITLFVHKERPELHGMRITKTEKPDCTESLWNTLFITDVEVEFEDGVI